ncbi:MAG: sensor domain-containing protein, partial [Mycobacterium sp.]
AGAVAVMTVSLSGTAAAAPQLVDQGKINSIMLSKDDVSSIIGSTMTSEQSYPRPQDPADVGDKSACAVLFGPDTTAFGDDYEAFKQDNQQDGDENSFDHVVVQLASIYADADTPAKLFHDAFKSVSDCGGPIHVSFPDGSADWQIQPLKVTDTGAQWTMAHLVDGKPNGWRCSKDTRVQSNVMLAATICQYGNPSRIASLVADRMIAGSGAEASS